MPVTQKRPSQGTILHFLIKAQGLSLQVTKRDVVTELKHMLPDTCKLVMYFIRGETVLPLKRSLTIQSNECCSESFKHVQDIQIDDIYIIGISSSLVFTVVEKKSWFVFWKEKNRKERGKVEKPAEMTFSSLDSAYITPHVTPIGSETTDVLIMKDTLTQRLVERNTNHPSPQDWDGSLSRLTACNWNFHLRDLIDRQTQHI